MQIAAPDFECPHVTGSWDETIDTAAYNEDLIVYIIY